MSASDFWNRRILSWERARYRPHSVFNPMSWGVRARLAKATAALSDIANNQSTLQVFDLGCGTGRLAQRLPPGMSYVGVDISAVAIQEAKMRINREGYSFHASCVTKVELAPDSFCVMLGLTDWLSVFELQVLFKKMESQDLLVSYTAKSRTASSAIYEWYRAAHDFKKEYSARRFTDAEFEACYESQGWHLYRDLTTVWMRPGRLLWLKRDISKK